VRVTGLLGYPYSLMGTHKQTVLRSMWGGKVKRG